MAADRGFWSFPEPIDSCSRCGARRPAVVDYVCTVPRESGRPCGRPAFAVVLGRDAGRCRFHLISALWPRKGES